MLCGDPAKDQTTWNPTTSENGWFGSPDNVAIDPAGNLWVSTDDNDDTGAGDGLWSLGTHGEARATGRNFFRAPAGAEACGPRFFADGATLFVARHTLAQFQTRCTTKTVRSRNPPERWLVHIALT